MWQVIQRPLRMLTGMSGISMPISFVLVATDRIQATRRTQIALIILINLINLISQMNGISQTIRINGTVQIIQVTRTPGGTNR